MDEIRVTFILQRLSREHLHCDNRTTIEQLREHTITLRTRHIDIRFYSACEYITGRLIDLVKIAGDDDVADVFT